MPTCFVIMPFGEKPLIGDQKIDFDHVYERLIASAAHSLDLDVIRSDQANLAGWIHKEMINQIFHADVCIVDLTTLNPNVFYELGVRHALRRGVTVLIKHEIFKLPFNIGGMSTISYNLDSFDKARDTIAAYVKNGLARRHNDSLVYETIPRLDVRTGPEQPITKTRYLRYPLNGRARHAAGLAGGDLKNVRGIPVWVNSENTNMQMARAYDRSISSTIRFLGAKKDQHDNILRDVIAEELARKVGTARTVRGGKVYTTSSGDLKDHDVRVIMHVAAVQGGRPGGGYKSVDNIGECVTNVLDELADNKRLAAPSVLFPLLGTGTGAGQLEKAAEELIDSAVTFLEDNETADIDTVWFLTYSERDWSVCQHELDKRRYGGALAAPQALAAAGPPAPGEDHQGREPDSVSLDWLSDPARPCESGDPVLGQDRMPTFTGIAESASTSADRSLATAAARLPPAAKLSIRPGVPDAVVRVRALRLAV